MFHPPDYPNAPKWRTIHWQSSRVHFTKLSRSPLAPVYLALLEDRGQKGQQASRAGPGVMAQV